MPAARRPALPPGADGAGVRGGRRPLWDEPDVVDDRTIYRRPDAVPLRPGGARPVQAEIVDGVPVYRIYRPRHAHAGPGLMPIRSPHGRSAAYRVLWQWPLRSPARLVLTAIGVVALVIAATIGIGRTTNGSVSLPVGARPTPSAAAVAPPEPVLLPPVPELEPTTLPVSAAPAAALQVASRWARAWVRPPDGTTAARWLDGLRSTTTDEYLGVLAGR